MTHEPIDFSVCGQLDWAALPEFTRKLHSISTADSDRFRLDLSELTFCGPAGQACLVAGIHYLRLREQECIEVVRPRGGSVRRYIERVGLFELLGEEDLYPYQRRAPAGRFVELVRVTGSDQIAGATTAICEVFSQKCNLHEQNRRALDSVLSEVAENVFHHAQSPTGAYLCCQSFQNSIAAAIVDLGDGIRRRLSDTEAWQRFLDQDGGPLRAAVTRKVTSRPAHNSGYGLALAAGLVELNGGEMGIYSQRDRLTQQGKEYFEHETPERWPGTVISFVLNRSGPLDVTELYDTVWADGSEESFDFLDEL